MLTVVSRKFHQKHFDNRAIEHIILSSGQDEFDRDFQTIVLCSENSQKCNGEQKKTLWRKVQHSRSSEDDVKIRVEKLSQ